MYLAGNQSATAVFVIFSALAIVQPGCDRSSPRQSIQGTVMIDNQPLTAGQISFRPQSGTNGPSAGAIIDRGTFTIPSIQGTFVGTSRVEITAVKMTGRKIKIPGDQLIDEVVNYIPARYNINSELSAEVKDNCPNNFEFSLQSK